MLLRNQDGAIIGVLKNGIFTKKVDSRVHKLRIIDGYGIDENAFTAAVLAGAETIVVKETDTGKTLYASAKLFRAKCQEFNFGHGKQVALAGKYWTLHLGQDELFPE
jgi:hypothetical protein